MTADEINAEMVKFTEALRHEKDLAFQKAGEDEEQEAEQNVFDVAKENIHKMAIECLDKILTPELKVFVKNLCLNTLGYPDEPVFYKVFGDYPKEGDKVSEASVVEKGIDMETFLEYQNLWLLEGNWVEKETIDGERYFVIKYLVGSEDAEPESVRKILRVTAEAKRVIYEQNLASVAKKALTCLDQLTPILGGIRI